MLKKKLVLFCAKVASGLAKSTDPFVAPVIPHPILAEREGTLIRLA